MNEKTPKEYKVDIDNGTAFFSDEFGIMHNPLRLIMDFRSITPRIDVRNKDFQPLVLKHNIVMMDMFMAKTFLEILKNNIDNYEKEFGKIEKPAALKKFEKEQKKMSEAVNQKDNPSYFG
jgi:hypothetical protein